MPLPSDELPTQPDAEEIRQRHKTAMLLQLHAKITQLLVEISPKLTLDEFIIRQIIFIYDQNGIESDANNFPDFMQLTKTSINRKLNKLVELDYLERSKKGRKYIYRTSEKILANPPGNKDGGHLTDPIFGKILDMIETLIRD